MVGINTVWVLISVVSLSASCGLIGAYIMLFKQALTTDAISHAALPGVAIGFFMALYLGLNDGRFLPILLMGGMLTGGLCSFLINYIIKKTRLTEDNVIAACLSVFFGLGILLFSIIQNMSTGNRSGLDSFLLGQVSGLVAGDALLITLISLAAGTTAVFYHKHFLLQSFDRNYAGLVCASQNKAKIILSALTLIIVCVGLKTAGAVLILAMLVIPPATGRLLSDKIKAIIIISMVSGILAASTGALISSAYPNIPAGAAIVICNATVFFCVMMVSLMKTQMMRAAHE